MFKFAMRGDSQTCRQYATEVGMSLNLHGGHLRRIALLDSSDTSDTFSLHQISAALPEGSLHQSNWAGHQSAWAPVAPPAPPARPTWITWPVSGEGWQYDGFKDFVDLCFRS